MPVRAEPYSFPALNRETFKGLPGLICDSLPDSFGHTLIDVWLAESGRNREYFNPVDRLCYVGNRGIGALEYVPALHDNRQNTLEISHLVDLTNRVLSDRHNLLGSLAGKDDRVALQNVLRVGTSAGGARAKAVLAWNPNTGEFRSGQIDTRGSFEHWILKFDGISNDRNQELADTQGYGRIEYAYFLMARQAGIDMADCRLYHEGGRSHFMTRRFDRNINGRKVHMQSLGALQHFDFNQPRVYAYEQVIQTIRELKLGMPVVEQQFRRTLFNIVARNQDDHVKNIAFLMDQSGKWRLSPAYDIVYAFNPSHIWTKDHQMSIVGKFNNFELRDLFRFAESSGIKTARARRAITEVVSVVRDWPIFAKKAGVDPEDIRRIAKTHRTNLN